MIIVSGDSMKNAGIEHGDRLHVYADVTVSDGDINQWTLTILQRFRLITQHINHCFHINIRFTYWFT